jgi:aerobic carbon-monoxide dehydrogenase medium subunit
VAAALEMDGNVCRAARVGLTGASTHAQRLTQVEDALAGKELTQANIDAAANLAADGLEDVNSDIHASEAYRRAMVKVFTRRAIQKAAGR